MTEINTEIIVSDKLANRSRVLLSKTGQTYFVPDISKDYHCEFGSVSVADLTMPDGSHVKTKKDVEFTIFDASAYDKYRRLKRVAAIILPKEAGAILANTMIDSESVCVDAGGGSGALTCFLAQYAKKVYCYDIRKDHLDTVKKNVEMLGQTNVEMVIGNVYESIPVDAGSVDLVTLDVPEPHRALDNVSKVLRAGRFLVCYLPNANQVQALAVAVLGRSDFVVVKTMEIIEREWDVDDRRCRPSNTGLMHTAFLTFIRKI